MSAIILVIDDEPNITLSFCSLLKDEGYETVSSSSAEEGLNYIEKNHVDLILLDIQLPKMSGLDFLQSLREMRVCPHVLVISGKAEIKDALQAIRLGAVDFLEKPVQPERLISSVKSVLMYIETVKQRNSLIDEIDNSSQIIGDSKIVKHLLNKIKNLAASAPYFSIISPGLTVLP